MRILIIEDDETLCSSLKKTLESSAFAVDTSNNGIDGSYKARVNEYDLIVLDNSLPKKIGLEVCKDIRKAKVTTPILMISINSAVPEKVLLLRSGVDDYLAKPFNIEEFLARVEAILRRPQYTHDEIITLGDLKLNTKTKEVMKGKRKIHFTRKEYILFEYLMLNKCCVISRRVILEHVWDDDIDPFSNTVETHIRNIRRKIGTKKQPYVYTFPARGYKIDTKR